MLALGMLVIARVQTQLRLHADVARQRTEAVRIAQEDIETLRAFAVIAASAGARSYAGIAGESRAVDQGVGFRLTRQIDTLGGPHAKNAVVTVRWTERGGGEEQVVLHSIIAGSDPAYRGALGLARSSTGRAGAPLGRSPRIPLSAQDLGNGSSAFKPLGNGAVAFVFDNRSGALSARCTGVGATLATRDLTLGSLGTCSAITALWLSGSVRFSSATPPDAAHPTDAPLAATMSLALEGGGHAGAPECSTEAMKTVSYSNGGSRRVEAVPIDASAALFGLSGWVETGERHLAYHCAVRPNASGRWSGRVTLLPLGWSIGTAAVERRVCRYSSDLDRSGAIDANIENPASYANVDVPLAQQNFLVINGAQACPAGNAMQFADTGARGFVETNTAQHQP